MYTTIVLIRHGETEWNTVGKFQGATDIPLSDNGKLQAKQLRKKFALFDDWNLIYSSPLKRALETAEIIASPRNIQPIICNDLTEICFGLWEGLTINDIKDKYPSEYALWINDPVNGPICGGDLSTRNASIRAKRGILDIVDKHPGEKILVVAHGGIIKAALIGLFNWDMTMYNKMFLKNTAVSVLKFDNNLKPILDSFNDVSHLEQKTV
ncbi:histidine phosphatase family protein [Clostridium oryzae]|uniref:Phosphoserine phosphatase 1 n=1 Tax=Clostridium oryzae TaxID=1450648 RepID=A0A1V4ISY8_9CLOT|nr:histidine phosphatase family protein [Clostridium oryzae]OPJ63009.1 phosphoserine phosphatase 1 [Clostridium oryzae]